jgi:hypothetical protein
MLMKSHLRFLFICGLLCFCNFSIAQVWGHLSGFYSHSGCGLNYTQATVKLGKKTFIHGINQPAPLIVSGIPSCAVIEKAFIWAVETGNGSPITATLTNPYSTTANFPMTVAGSTVDICWGRPGTYTFRADVTSLITGNGTYSISNMPVDSTTNTGNDVEGATLLIIYEDPSATYTGNILIDDGCIGVVVGGTASDTIQGVNSCTNSSYANGFMILADLKYSGATYQFSGNPVSNFVGQNYMNFLTAPVHVNSTQTSFTSMFHTNVDCFALAVNGLYFQNSCTSCVPIASNLTLNATSTPDSCNHDGTATVIPTGGTGPYTYSWSIASAMNAPTINNLPAGTYTVAVNDATHCGYTTITVGYSGMTLVASSTMANCNGGGSATVSITGGASPYSYSWSCIPIQTSQTATNLVAGTYTVMVTDQAGCTSSKAVNVGMNSIHLLMTDSSQICTRNGSCHVVVSGGSPPYSYSWSTTPSQNGPNATNLPAGTYTVLVTDQLGCSASKIDTVDLVNSVITLLLTDSDQVCGVLGSANVLPSGGTPPYTYAWSTTPTQTTPRATNLPSGGYAVQVIDSNGCYTSGSVYVPYVFLSVSASGFSMSCNSSNQLQAVANDPAATFSWSPSAGLSSTIISNPITSTLVSQTYTVTATASCGSSFNYATVTISANNPNVEAICCVTVDTTTGKNKIIWQRNIPLSSGLYSVYKETTVPGIYSLLKSQPVVYFTSLIDTSSLPALGPSRYELTTTDTCGNESAFSTDHRTMFLTVSAGIGSHWNLNWNAYEGFTGSYYYIYRGSTPHNISKIDSVAWGTTAYIDTVPPPGLLYYAVIAINPTGCNPTRSFGFAYSISNISLTGILTGLGNQAIESSLKIYPNPSHGNITIDFELQRKEALTIEVCNGLGQILLSEKAGLVNGPYHQEMDIGMLSKGIYFLRISTEEGTLRRKLIVE